MERYSYNDGVLCLWACSCFSFVCLRTKHAAPSLPIRLIPEFVENVFVPSLSLCLYRILSLSRHLAAIGRAVEAALPEGMGASEETIDALNKSCAEFVCLVSSEARTVRSSSVMSREDVVEAIKRLGLEAYLEGAEEVAAADAEKVHAHRKRKKKPKQSKEEQEAAASKQRELLQATAESFYSERGL
ncbi:unnamed protein product [Laminaria digitata]